MMKTLFKIFPVIPLIFFGACTNSDMAGGTTETENAIAQEEAAYVSIQVYNGKKPAKASYRVLPSWFVTDSTGSVSDDDFVYVGKTDSLGNIRIDNHQEGSYTIQIEQGDSALVYQYTLNGRTKNFSISNASLKKKGAVKGWLSLPEKAKYAWVNIEGIGRVAKTDSLGFFVMESLPVGKVSLKSWSNDNVECIAEANAFIPAGDTLHIGHMLAPNKSGLVQTLEINPIDLVSDWMRPLSVPFVLTLRLDSTNFDFSKARKDGSDLQLFASNGSTIPMVIDSWETDIKSAVINIRLEDLADTADTWTLEWGDPDVTAPEKKTNVWKGISDSLWYELNSIEIFNFESGGSRSDLPSPLRSDSWYAQLHKLDTLTDSVTISYISTAAITEANNWLGKVFHIEYKVDYPDIVVFGTRLTRHPHDWSRMDSLVVWMKTDGDFEIILESLDEDLNYKASYKGKGKGLTDWTRYVIKPEDFTYKIRDYHGWEFVRNKITNFTVFTYNSTELWLDNVRAYGVNRDDLK